LIEIEDDTLADWRITDDAGYIVWLSKGFVLNESEDIVFSSWVGYLLIDSKTFGFDDKLDASTTKVVGALVGILGHDAGVICGLLFKGDVVISTIVGPPEVGNFEVGAFDVGAFDVGIFDVGWLDVGWIDVGLFDVGTFDIGGDDVGCEDVGKDDIGRKVHGGNVGHIVCGEDVVIVIGEGEIGLTEVGNNERDEREGYIGADVVAMGDDAGELVCNKIFPQYGGGFCDNAHICCCIHGTYALIRTFTPGTPGLAHPSPNDTIPTCILVPDKNNGPPESPI
jgi:hypothetical protein